MKKKGMFIVFEGTEGCGKTTQAKKIFHYLKRKRFDVIFTREPGGTGVAEGIRKILLHTADKLNPMTELMLYEASRVQHIDEVVKPALDSGKIVVCDRFIDSTVAYQSFGRGLDLGVVEKLNDIASGGIMPDLTVLIDASLKKGLALAKLASKGGSGDRLENEKIGFHKMVKKGFMHQLKKHPKRIKLVKQMPAQKSTFSKIKREVDEVIKRNRDRIKLV